MHRFLMGESNYTLSNFLNFFSIFKAASPACTELEVIMLDWVGRMIGLPSDFLCFDGQDKSRGGGVIQVSR